MLPQPSCNLPVSLHTRVSTHKFCWKAISNYSDSRFEIALSISKRRHPLSPRKRALWKDSSEPRGGSWSNDRFRANQASGFFLYYFPLYQPARCYCDTTAEV
jgi:hypothetical protein